MTVFWQLTGFLFFKEMMVVFWLGNDNTLAAYLCSAAGRGMHMDHEFASGSLKTQTLLSVPKRGKDM